MIQKLFVSVIAKLCFISQSYTYPCKKSTQNIRPLILEQIYLKNGYKQDLLITA